MSLNVYLDCCGAAGAVLLVCACEPEATPLPVNLPEPSTATPTASAPQLLRYALAPNAAAISPPTDQAQIAANAEIITLDAPPTAADLGARYDIVVALGDLPDGTRAPHPSAQSDCQHCLSAARRSGYWSCTSRVDPQRSHALGRPAEQVGRASPARSAARRLANAGYPDGFDLTLAAEFAPARMRWPLLHATRHRRADYKKRDRTRTPHADDAAARLTPCPC